MDRNSKGQFVVTTGSTKRKRVMYRGNNMHRYDREFCILLGINKIPRGLVVHHIDGNPSNDDIDNLALMTHTAHNRIHAPNRHVWNKGLTVNTSKKLRKTVNKIKDSREKYFFPIFKETYELKSRGLTLQQIANEQGISRRQVSDRLNRYHELKEKYGN